MQCENGRIYLRKDQAQACLLKSEFPEHDAWDVLLNIRKIVSDHNATLVRFNDLGSGVPQSHVERVTYHHDIAAEVRDGLENIVNDQIEVAEVALLVGFYKLFSQHQN